MSALNIFMAIFLVGFFVATILVMRHLILNIDKVGETRFDTRNKSDIDG